MVDSYGDGWHGNMFTVDGESFTIDYGSTETGEVCLEPGCYDVSLDGGSWQSEISWEFAGYTGGAPYYGQICVGDEPEPVVEEPTCDDYDIYMYDSYGDGWHGNMFTVDGESFTIDYGSSETGTVCLEPGCYSVTLDGGSW